MSEFDPRISPEDVALWMEGRLKGHDLTPPEYYEKNDGWVCQCLRCRPGSLPSLLNTLDARFSSAARRRSGWFTCNGNPQGT